MSDLLRVVERSRDDVMEVENYMAREQSGGEGADPTAPQPRRRLSSVSSALRAAAAPVWDAALAHPFVRGLGDGTLRRGRVPVLHPPGLPVPDRLRAAAVAGRRAGAAAGVDAALRRARVVGAGDRDGPAPRVRGALGRLDRGAGVRARGAGHRRVLRLPAARRRPGRLRRARARRSRRACGATRRSASPCAASATSDRYARVDRHVRERRVRRAGRVGALAAWTRSTATWSRMTRGVRRVLRARAQVLGRRRSTCASPRRSVTFAASKCSR